MKLTLEIESTEDARQAQKVLAAYLNDEAVEAKPDTSGTTKEVAEKPTKKTVAKKAPAKKPAKEEVEDEVETETSDEDGMDLKTLTAIAKDAVAKSDRATVKETIGEFGDKLSSVDEADYDALAKKLKSL